MTKNPKVDGTDFYMFRSYEEGREAFTTLIADYQPFQDGFAGPNYYDMDPEALYEIHIDNDGDAHEDVTFQFRFHSALANNGKGLSLDIGGKDVAVPFLNLGPINPLAGGSVANLNRIESYSVKVVRGDRRGGESAEVTRSGGGEMFMKPTDYIGTKSLGSHDQYEAYARSHIYEVAIPGCDAPARIFVGQRAEPFAVNVGTIFDLINAPASVVTGGGTRAGRDLAPNPLAMKNITTIALEVPTSFLKGTGSVIGGWQTASVRQVRVINPHPTYASPTREGGAWTQVSRLGMPLVNEVVIGLKDKDRFNASQPKDDAQFADYVTNPTLAAVIEVLFGPTVKAPTRFPRTDLVAAFLTGVENVNKNGATAEYQRLNVTLPITPAGKQNSLGAAGCFVNGNLTLDNPGCDPAGFPNGRRPGDDVTDIELRVMMGYLLPTSDAPSGQVPFTDAVLQEDSQFCNRFPYLNTPTPGAGSGS